MTVAECVAIHVFVTEITGLAVVQVEFTGGKVAADGVIVEFSEATTTETRARRPRNAARRNFFILNSGSSGCLI